MQIPKVFQNPINKKINNSQELFYERNKPIIKPRNTQDISKIINDIFSSSNHIYKSKVLITTKDGEMICDIIGKTPNSLLSMDGNIIRINEIIDIKKI